MANYNTELRKRTGATYGDVYLVKADYNQLANVPSTFVPVAHSHPTSDVTGLDTALGAKQDFISAGTSLQYYRGDKTWQTLPTSLPASDVYSWAKASVKPSYTPEEILSAGFGDSINPYASKTAKYFCAAPNAAAGSPSFRAIVASDIPTLNQNTTGSAATLATARTLTIGATGKTFNGGANVSWSVDEIGASPKYAGIPSGSTTRSLATTDVNGVIMATGAVTFTIPAGTFTVGSQITIVRSGTSTVTITGAAGVYVNGTSAGSVTITTQWKAITLICYASNYFVAVGA